MAMVMMYVAVPEVQCVPMVAQVPMQAQEYMGTDLEIYYANLLNQRLQQHFQETFGCTSPVSETSQNKEAPSEHFQMEERQQPRQQKSNRKQRRKRASEERQAARKESDVETCSSYS
mmetsp:Transcript_81364/g.143595  ORF Transcript_81364/g.143595 Transcript_81364/m.143595 type:complete len:117 (+) Transcript_81364:40-390(+)|eukprot:CAMPEP_0197659258 /NCGR_PEP_ID=MMETSP1338-20131121/46909_1 /TAXON_ID=43686 ORGANISM="Pelagodinium beii, Strain RCC1491" /NCGR_SAMPLE_ID=MMETSP1338 /ASSEMBLY_ACC=CAM_ASM_000754 /LENGTH=116 /DNA_ID=CAMNT_0043236099 /DNA_START=29 /DNA_END=379 /DNA_ORIENTATION=-